MNKKTVIKRDFTYLHYLLAFVVLMILSTEIIANYFSSWDFEKYAGINNITHTNDSTIEDFTELGKIKDNISLKFYSVWLVIVLSFLIAMVRWLWLGRIKNFILHKMLVLSLVVFIFFAVVLIIGYYDPVWPDLDEKGSIRILYFFLTLPLLIMTYEKVLIGEVIDDTDYRRDKATENYKYRESSLFMAKEDGVITEEEFNSKLKVHKEKYKKELVLYSSEFLKKHSKLKRALDEEIITEEEYAVKLEDLKKEFI